MNAISNLAALAPEASTYALARHLSVMDRRHNAADDAWLASEDPKEADRLIKVAHRLSLSLEPIYQAALAAEPHDIRDVAALMVLVSAGLGDLKNICEAACEREGQETAGKLLSAVLLSLPIMAEHVGVSLQDIGGTYCLAGGGPDA